MDEDFFDDAQESGPVGLPFNAAYASTCSEIYDDIQPGDRIMADGHGGFAHVSCIRQSARGVIWE